MLDRVVSRSECSEQLDIVNSFMCLFLKSQEEEKINREGEEKKKGPRFRHPPQLSPFLSPVVSEPVRK